MLKFCLKKSAPKDYEVVAYESEVQRRKIQEQIEANRSKLNTLNTIKRNISQASRVFTERPDFHSTQLHHTTTNNMYFSKYEFEITKLAYESEIIFSDDSNMFTNSSIESNCSVQSIADDEATVYVCSENYEAQFQGDLSLKYSERVHVLHVNDDFTLVKKVSTDEKGFVPTSCLALFSTFIKTVQFV